MTWPPIRPSRTPIPTPLQAVPHFDFAPLDQAVGEAEDQRQGL